MSFLSQTHWPMFHEEWFNITQLNPYINITIWLTVENISYLSIDELKEISNEWFIRHNSWWRFCKWGFKQSRFNYGGNSIVKHAWAGVVLGWVTSREVPMLHPREHHLDPTSAKCSIYSHERWIHVETLLMKHGSSSLTQNHTIKSWYSHHNLTCCGNYLLLINWWA